MGKSLRSRRRRGFAVGKLYRRRRLLGLPWVNQVAGIRRGYAGARRGYAGGPPGVRRGSAGGTPGVRRRVLRGFSGGILKTRKSAGPGAGVAGGSPWVYEIETPGNAGAGPGAGTAGGTPWVNDSNFTRRCRSGAGPGAGPAPVPTQVQTHLLFEKPPF